VRVRLAPSLELVEVIRGVAGLPSAAIVVVERSIDSTSTPPAAAATARIAWRNVLPASIVAVSSRYVAMLASVIVPPPAVETLASRLVPTMYPASPAE